MVCIGLIHRDFDQNDFSNTATETEVWSYTVASGTLSDDRMLRFGLTGLVSQNTGSTKHVDFRINFDDGTTSDNMNITDVVAENGNRTYTIDIQMLAKNSADAQASFGKVVFGSEDLQSKDESLRQGRRDSQSLDSDNKDIDVTVYATLETAHTGFSIHPRQHWVELV